MGPGPGTQTSDDPSFTWGLSTLAAYVLICTGTMHHVLYCDTPAYYSEPSNGEPARQPGRLRNEDTRATRKAKAVIALAQRDYRMARRPQVQTAALQHWADEQDRPSELTVVIPRSHRPTSPCSHIHTHRRPLWRVRWLDVRNTTLGLLVPEHRQGSYPVPCRWKDEPG